MGLCQGEKDFRKRRLPFVCKAMKKQLNDQGPSNEMEVIPVLQKSLQIKIFVLQ